MRRVILKGYKNGQAILLINMAISKAYTLGQFQDTRIRYIENTKHYFDKFETEFI